MKLGIFTDSHYSSATLTCGKRYNSASLGKIAEAYEYFAAEGCETVICLGDLIDREPDHEREIQNLAAVARVIRSSGLPTLCLPGNHDAFALGRDEFYGILGEVCRPPQMLTRDGVTLLFLDTCYYSDGTPYSPGQGNWKDTFLPRVSELPALLAAAEGDIYVFMHQNIDPALPENHRLSNDAAVRRALNSARVRAPEGSGRVRAVLQGHYHKGARNTHGGIDYITFPAMCEGEGRRWVYEIDPLRDL